MFKYILLKNLSPGWPRTHCITHAELKLKATCPHVCTTIPPPLSSPFLLPSPVSSLPTPFKSWASHYVAQVGLRLLMYSRLFLNKTTILLSESPLYCHAQLGIFYIALCHGLTYFLRSY